MHMQLPIHIDIYVASSIASYMLRVAWGCLECNENNKLASHNTQLVMYSTTGWQLV